MRPNFTLALALLALLPAFAHAQQPQERIEAARARAIAAGIPVALLDSKLAEGRAKGISIERIADVIERRELTLRRAQVVLADGGRVVSAADFAAGADALAAGISEAVLRALSAAAPQERRAVAITALTELVVLGEAPEEALRRVTEALTRTPDALTNLPAQARGQGRAQGRGQGGQGGPPAGTPGAGRGRGPPGGVPGPGQRPGRGRGRPSGN